MSWENKRLENTLKEYNENDDLGYPKSKLSNKIMEFKTVNFFGNLGKKKHTT